MFSFVGRSSGLLSVIMRISLGAKPSLSRRDDQRNHQIDLRVKKHTVEEFCHFIGVLNAVSQLEAAVCVLVVIDTNL